MNKTVKTESAEVEKLKNNLSVMDKYIWGVTGLLAGLLIATKWFNVFDNPCFGYFTFLVFLCDIGMIFCYAVESTAYQRKMIKEIKHIRDDIKHMKKEERNRRGTMNEGNEITDCEFKKELNKLEVMSKYTLATTGLFIGLLLSSNWFSLPLMNLFTSFVGCCTGFMLGTTFLSYRSIRRKMKAHETLKKEEEVNEKSTE